jgi:hypothetical protein
MPSKGLGDTLSFTIESDCIRACYTRPRHPFTSPVTHTGIAEIHVKMDIWLKTSQPFNLLLTFYMNLFISYRTSIGIS